MSVVKYIDGEPDDSKLIAMLMTIAAKTSFEDLALLRDGHLIRLLPLLDKLPASFQENALLCLSNFPILNEALMKCLGDFCLCTTVEPHVIVVILDLVTSSHGRKALSDIDLVTFYVHVLSIFKVESGTRHQTTARKQTLIDIQDLIGASFSKLPDVSQVVVLMQDTIIGNWPTAPLDNQVAMAHVLDNLIRKLPDTAPDKLVDILIQYLQHILEFDTKTTLFPNFRRMALMPIFSMLIVAESLLDDVIERLQGDEDEGKITKSCRLFCERCKDVARISPVEREKKISRKAYIAMKVESFLSEISCG